MTESMLVADLIEAEQGSGKFYLSPDPRPSQVREVVEELQLLCGVAYRRIQALEKRLEEAEEEEGRDES